MKKDILTFGLFLSNLYTGMNRVVKSLFTEADASVPSSYITPPEDSRKPDVRDSLKTELFFGLSKPDGKLISEKEWQAFTDRYITPAFDKGLTVMDAAGQWKMFETGKIVKEKTKVLILLHDNDEISERHINRIRENYMKFFRQESVLRITCAARICV